jgi:hypothetical protein
MKITIHRPILIDAATGTAVGNFDMEDEGRAKQLVARGLASEGYNAKAIAGAPVNRMQHAQDSLLTREASPAPRTARTQNIDLTTGRVSAPATASAAKPATAQTAARAPATKPATKTATKTTTKTTKAAKKASTKRA